MLIFNSNLIDLGSVLHLITLQFSLGNEYSKTETVSQNHFSVALIK